MPRPGSIAQSRNSFILLAAAALLAAVATLLVAGHAAAAGNAKVKVGKTALGPIVVNAQGRTLYMFALDKHGKSACYGQCATFWPPLLTTSAHVSAAGLKASLLGTTKRTDGKLQVTYNGHPLYTFAQDAKAGQTRGQGVNAAGGLWWVVSPTGAVIKHAPVKTTTTTSATTTSAGGGYGYPTP